MQIGGTGYFVIRVDRATGAVWTVEVRHGQQEKVNSDLVARDHQGKPYSVRYEAVNAMLLNEFLKARRQFDAQQKQIEVLTAGLQKVSAEIELSKAAPQTVSNKH
jgi:hypothetical protein